MRAPQRHRTPEMEQALRTAASHLVTFSTDDLCTASGAPSWAALDMIKLWQQSGLVEDTGQRVRARVYWRAVQPLLDPAAKPGTAVPTPTGNMWRSMQLLKSFCPSDIKATAQAGPVSISHEDATAYCQLLCRAGYLRVMKKAVPPREAIYRLTRDTGPLPPVLKRVRAVIDQNLGEIVHFSGGLL